MGAIQEPTPEMGLFHIEVRGGRSTSEALPGFCA